MGSDEIMQADQMKTRVVKKFLPNGDDMLILPLNSQYDSVLVWLHGRGDKAESFTEMFLPTTY